MILINLKCNNFQKKKTKQLLLQIPKIKLKKWIQNIIIITINTKHLFF